MQTRLDELKDSRSWEELLREFSNFLELDGPMPEAVLHRALEDEKFAAYLVSMRGRPDYLQMMFNDPQNKQYETRTSERRSNVKMLKKATGALLKWGKAGFKKVDDETFNRRFAACQACEHFVDAPDQLLYKVRMVKDVDTRICDECGCVASRKARLPTETCPARDRGNGGLSRWGEPMKSQP